jgi:hypothetical protein
MCEIHLRGNRDPTPNPSPQGTHKGEGSAPCSLPRVYYFCPSVPRSMAAVVIAA